MGRSYRKEKNWGPKKKGRTFKYNERREERQKIRRQRESELDDMVNKVKNNEELDDWEEYERFRENRLK